MNHCEIEHLTIAEAIKIFGIGRTKLYELMNAGQVEAVKFGRRTLIKRESLQEFMSDLPRFGGEHQ